MIPSHVELTELFNPDEIDYLVAALAHYDSEVTDAAGREYVYTPMRKRFEAAQRRNNWIEKENDNG